MFSYSLGGTYYGRADLYILAKLLLMSKIIYKRRLLGYHNQFEKLNKVGSIKEIVGLYEIFGFGKVTISVLS